ncbi:hypothetical protein L6452_41938 [Arctium lappa]|uniref:Uncharacterized protein n=1 Tax=Arctium lappa TaxID=4217 RepID=A0ACB8XGC0_ARCLA|nr:hypothetical protein L6452_41938 [Arctium lappa]
MLFWASTTPMIPLASGTNSQGYEDLTFSSGGFESTFVSIGVVGVIGVKRRRQCCLEVEEQTDKMKMKEERELLNILRA